MMTGTVRVRSEAFNASATWNPSIAGICASSSTTSGTSASAVVHRSQPVFGGDDPVAVELHLPLQQRPHAFVVVHHQHQRFFALVWFIPASNRVAARARADRSRS